MTGDPTPSDLVSASQATAVTVVTMVTLLTKPDCPLCEHAKTVLARVGADHPLRVEEISLDSANGALLAGRAGVLFAPGILLDGAPFAFGRLSERALRRALDRRTTARKG